MDSTPLPISSGPLIFCEGDRRPMLTKSGPLVDAMRDPEQVVFHQSVERVQQLADPTRWYYEVVVHRRASIPDSRCVVARFLDYQDLEAALPVLCDAWRQSYAYEASAHGAPPCPN